MANSLLAQELNEYYEDNLERYVKEHPGEYILIEQIFMESFYATQSELNNAIQKKYGNSMSYTIIGTQIPKEMSKKNRR